jgi:hypothetical protein
VPFHQCKHKGLENHHHLLASVTKTQLKDKTGDLIDNLERTFEWVIGKRHVDAKSDKSHKIYILDALQKGKEGPSCKDIPNSSSFVLLVRTTNQVMHQENNVKEKLRKPVYVRRISYSRGIMPIRYH